MAAALLTPTKRWSFLQSGGNSISVPFAVGDHFNLCCAKHLHGCFLAERDFVNCDFILWKTEEENILRLSIFALRKADIFRLRQKSCICGCCKWLRCLLSSMRRFLLILRKQRVQFSIRAWTNIQQIVSSFTNNIDQLFYKFICRFINIVRNKAPAIAHGHTGFPRVRQPVSGNMLFGCR